MSETEFLEQEEKRRTLEKRKHAILEGKPIPGSVEELLESVKQKLQENFPTLQEFIIREHKTNLELMNRLDKQIANALIEQNLASTELLNELRDIKTMLTEQIDNFNLFANTFLEEQRAHRMRIQKTCDLIDKELTL